MRSALGWACLAVLLRMFLLPATHAASPRVVLTRPGVGESRVSPGLAEVVVQFDQDMDTRGFSFVGGGPTVPPSAGTPFWRNSRECVLPVRLQPGHAYRIGINSATRRNFKSRDGEPATPLVLSFETGSGDATAVVAETPAEVRKEAVRQLREAVERRYSYREVHAINWDEAWQHYEPRLLAAGLPREFAFIAGGMLARTEDSHIWLSEGGETIPAFRRQVRVNISLDLLRKQIGDWSEPHPSVATGLAAPGVGYLAVHSWDRKYAPQLLESALKALEGFQELPGLILDLRANSGGDESQALEFAGCFIPEKKHYARHVHVDASAPGGFTAAFDRWIAPNPKGPPYTGKVAVLMGPINMSSAEAFLLMMRQAPRATLIGERSYGSSGNPQPHVLANGVTVHLPSWKAMLPDGSPLETLGVSPDIEVQWDANQAASTDPLIQRAVALLSGGEILPSK